MTEKPEPSEETKPETEHTRRSAPVTGRQLLALVMLTAAVIGVLALVGYALRLSPGEQFVTELSVLVLGALILVIILRGRTGVIAGAASIITAAVSLAALTQATDTQHTVELQTRIVTQYRFWATCPPTGTVADPGRPGALVTSTPDEGFIGSARSRARYGHAHINAVIAPDGSSLIRRQEKVCMSVLRYPGGHRMLWLILKLHFPHYNLYFAVGALSDPTRGKYSINIDRGCSANLAKGDRHTLRVVSAGPQATKLLWVNYNDRNRSHCNSAYDRHRHRLPPDTYPVSNQGDVVQS